MPGPLFFVDRSLGRVRVPALLRESGWALVTLAEHYGVPQDEAVGDVAWLRLAGERGWPVLMKDERIKYRTAERRARHQARSRHGYRASLAVDLIASGGRTERPHEHSQSPTHQLDETLRPEAGGSSPIADRLVVM